MDDRIGRADGGFLTIQFVGAAALSLVLLTMVVNAVAFQYARGVVQTAIADGARAGARAGGASGPCLAAAQDVLHGLLSPELAEGVQVTCSPVGSRTQARAVVGLEPWLPGLPAWRFTVSAVAPVEPTP